MLLSCCVSWSGGSALLTDPHLVELCLSCLMVDQQCVLLNRNVRGLNSCARRKVVFDMVRDNKATIVTLQETKLETVDRQTVVETLGDKFADNFVVLPAFGTSGGILLAVDGDHYLITGSEIGVHTVTATITTRSGRLSWSMTAVYGPQEDNDKLNFLGEIRWLQ